MEPNIDAELAALEQMTTGQLAARFAELFGESTRARNRRWLIKRIAWRIQARAEGGLSERAQRRAAELADESQLRLTAPTEDRPERSTRRSASSSHRDPRLPSAGTVLTRDYRGGLVQVTVLEKGFVWEGKNYRSLSAVARAVTGTHANGYLFFRLQEEVVQ